MFKGFWHPLKEHHFLNSPHLLHTDSGIQSKIWFLANDQKGQWSVRSTSNSVFIASSVQSLRHGRLFATPWIAARQASLSISNCQSLPKPMSIESVVPSSHLILCRFLLLLPPILPIVRVFSSEWTLCMRWPKYCSFQLQISPCNEYSGLISFKMDWLDLLLQSKGPKKVSDQLGQLQILFLLQEWLFKEIFYLKHSIF